MRALQSHVTTIGTFVAGIVLVGIVPFAVAPFTLADLTLYAAMAILAMSLGFIWGFGGILSFGQSVFFGVGGYTYAIVALNFDSPSLALLAAIAVAVIGALLLGYFIFWGRLSDVYLAVITLTISLIFFMLINSMSSSIYRIGDVPIGGYNGIPGIPPLVVPGTDRSLSVAETYVLVVTVALLVYLGLSWLIRTKFGRILCSIKENEVRAELLGYDARLYKLAAFAVGAAIAGMAGALFAVYSGLINPDVFGIGFSAQIIVWVMLGGLGTLIGPALGAVLIQMLVVWFGKVQVIDANMALGVLFIVAVLLVPAGLVPRLQGLLAVAFGNLARSRP